MIQKLSHLPNSLDKYLSIALRELLLGTPRVRKISGKSRSLLFLWQELQSLRTRCAISLSEDNWLQVVRNKRATQAPARGHWLPPGQRKYLANLALTQAGSQLGPADHTKVLCVPGTWALNEIQAGAWVTEGDNTTGHEQGLWGPSILPVIWI